MKDQCTCPNRESDPMIVDPTCPVHTTPKDQWKEVDERFGKKFPVDFFTMRENIDGMAFSKRNIIADFLHSELEKVRQETIRECIEALPRYEHPENKWCEKYDKKFLPCAGCLSDQAISAITNKKIR